MPKFELMRKVENRMGQWTVLGLATALEALPSAQ